MFDVWSIVLFGAMGYFFQKLKIPGSPFILGFILGPLVEINLRRGLMFSRGSFMPFLTSPISAVFLVATAVSISISAFKQYKAIQRRKSAAS
jgi:putative tricarboxylic transport membrane protein